MFLAWLDEMSDPRDADRIVYSNRHLVLLGLLMFLLQCGSRGQLEGDIHTAAFLRNLLALSGTDEDMVATSHAMNYLMEKMDPDKGMSLLPWRMANQLIRSRILDDRRNSANEFMVAVDGVHLHTMEGTLPKAVYKQVNGVTHSVFAALEAKLVTQDGMGFSVCTQFVENEEAYVKQDCELKAFYRLAETLKGRFPRLPLCLLLDGLYPNKNVLDICAANQWSYFITLKDGVIPTLHAAAARQLAKRPGQSLDDSPGPGVYRHVSWATSLGHEGRPVNVLVCEETTLTKGGFVKKRFVWLTNARPNREDAVQLVEEARCRWVIEETFNVQKNNEEYGLEHVYGRVGYAMKNYYYLLQVAHTLHQLMGRGDLFPKLQRKGIVRKFGERSEEAKALLAAVAKTTLEHFKTMKNFARRLAESFRTEPFSELATDPAALGAIQIRFNSC